MQIEMNLPLSSRLPSLPNPKPRSRILSRLADRPRAVVVGAGLAGLAAALRLHSSQVSFVLVEASDAVGGRVRTDSVDGFLLDRGFQIFISAYPEAQKLLDYGDLNLHKFYSGALVYCGDGQFHRVSDPFRHFADAVLSLGNPVGSLQDKLLIGLTRLVAVTRSDDEILTAEETSVLELLNQTGFSDSIINRFFRPFFGGIFFDPQLETTSRLFNFIFKCLALGHNTLPANGISAIPSQLASKLPPNSIVLNSKVVSISSADHSVKLHTGELLPADLGIILAVDQPEAAKLLLHNSPEPVKEPARSTACLYFSADRAPIQEPILILNGSGGGLVNNMFFATQVAGSYGPKGRTLVSVSIIGSREGVADEELTRVVVRELGKWFGDSVVAGWRHLRTYRIGFAQPNQSPPTKLVGRDPRVRSGVYLCGDYRVSATFDGALVSGRVAAEALLEDSKAFVEDTNQAVSFV